MSTRAMRIAGGALLVCGLALIALDMALQPSRATHGAGVTSAGAVRLVSRVLFFGGLALVALDWLVRRIRRTRA
jgi:hypothetical protein